MHFKGKLYIVLAISFILLFFSLYQSSQSIKLTSNMIDHIENNQLVLTRLASDLELEVKTNQSNILHSIALKDSRSMDVLHISSDRLNTIIEQLKSITKEMHLKQDKTLEILNTLQKRMVGYKSVEASIIEAIKKNNKEDIEDALIGFNLITIKFSDDISQLINYSNIRLYHDIEKLKESNNSSSIDILFSFFISIILIVFAVYKLTNLHNIAEEELSRAEAAEEEQKKLQSQLLKYNDDLEAEIAQKTKELHHKIYTNFLSGLPNRNKLLEDSNIYNFKHMALLNIDKFQKFNDVYGEEVGNIALKLSADFLLSQIEDNHTLLYHLGGDEFVIVVKDTSSMTNAFFIDTIEEILSKYKKENFIYEDKVFRFIMSAGISFSGKKKMLAYADIALKEAKTKNMQLSIFNDDKAIQKVYQEDIECHKRLLHAFDTNGILSYFQPIIPIQDSKKPTKYEALARITKEDGTVISPAQFIDVAKQNRIYHKLTKSVLENTLGTIMIHNIPCTINLSMEDIENTKTLKLLYSTFDSFEHNSLLTIELLETEEFKDYQVVYNFCMKIRSYGIKIALDDFGSGYSNFSHILNLPIDYIKIDSSLISNIDRDNHSKIMVETIVDLAKKLNIDTIAEFVSSQEILDVVKELKVDYAQGFHLGRPEPIEKHMKKTS